MAENDTQPSTANHVLLVEDSQTQALLLQAIFEDSGNRVSVVDSAEAALNLIRKDPPDIVVADLYLPGMRGDELCRQLRMNFETREIPVLMLTADSSEGTELSSLDSGADAFVAKSTDPEVLQTRVRSLIEKSINRTQTGDTSINLTHEPFQAARILTIDDSMTYLHFLQEELTADGYQVEQASDGEQGIDKLEADDYDCVVVDLVMPGMDGIEVCKQIDRIRKERNVPIVALMLTSNENKEDLTRALASGADDFVGKSSDTAVLKGRIRALLRRKFFQEENSRILEELKNKELEAVRARAEKDVAEARASLVEELEIARDAAEQASMTKSDFLANMSHEIRTPMNGVIGMTEMLLKTTLSDQQRNYANLVKHSAESLLALLNDILDFSKIEAGKMDIDDHAFQLREVVGETLHMLAMKASEKNLELSCRIPPEIPGTFIGDSVRLRQVLVNLIGNAVKFTEQGEISVHINLQQPETDGRMLLGFLVKDTGCGIPEDKLGTIFESFSQADSSTTRKFGGTGLGLSISRQLVELMGGNIAVGSQVDIGSEFNFTVDLGVPPEPQESSPTLPKATVLVVDESPTSRESLVEVLESYQLTVAAFDSGDRALTAVESGQDYDLAIVSLVMSKMDGVSLTEKLARNSKQDRPIVLLHPANRPLSEEEGERMMPSSCLLRPFNHLELIQSLKIALSLSTEEQSSDTKTESPAENLTILLAEDGRVNRVVAREMIEHMGHQITIVENGKEAVQFMERDGTGIDVILMDIQMPELNGFEATEQIRKSKLHADIPIIAMTANAMKGDREKCLAVGMVDYVAKPIRTNELAVALSKIQPRTFDELAPTEKIDPQLDIEAFLERFGSKPDLAKTLIEFYQEDSADFLNKIKKAIDERDDSVVGKAHSLKGLVGNYQAPGAHETLVEFYQAAQNQDWDTMRATYPTLKTMVNKLGESLCEIKIQAPDCQSIPTQI